MQAFSSRMYTVALRNLQKCRRWLKNVPRNSPWFVLYTLKMVIGDLIWQVSSLSTSGCTMFSTNTQTNVQHLKKKYKTSYVFSLFHSTHENVVGKADVWLLWLTSLEGMCRKHPIICKHVLCKIKLTTGRKKLYVRHGKKKTSRSYVVCVVASVRQTVIKPPDWDQCQKAVIITVSSLPVYSRHRVSPSLHGNVLHIITTDSESTIIKIRNSLSVIDSLSTTIQ